MRLRICWVPREGEKLNRLGCVALERGLLGLTQERVLLTPSPETSGRKERKQSGRRGRERQAGERCWKKGVGEEERTSRRFQAGGIFLLSLKLHGVFLCSQSVSPIKQHTSPNEQVQSGPFLPCTQRKAKSHHKNCFPLERLANQTGEGRRTNPRLRKAVQSS